MATEFEEKEINLREYFLVVVKRRWMILTIVLFIVTITGIYSFLQTPTYRSSATLYIDRGNYNIVPDVVSEQYSYQGYDNFFRTQYKLLKTKTLGERVVQRLNLTPADLADPKDKSKFKPAPTPEALERERKALADQLLTMVEVNPVKDTTLCEVAFVAKSPKLATALANAWVDEYVEYSISTRYEYTQKADEMLLDQIQSLQKEIAAQQKLLQDYSSDKQVVKLANDESMSSQTLEDLNKSLSEATQARINAQVHYQDLSSHGKQAVPDVMNNAVVIQMKNELATLERTYTDKSKVYKPDYPEMVGLKNQIDQTNQRISKEEDDAYSKVLSAAHAAYTEAANREKALLSQMDSAKRSTIESNRKEFSYDNLKVELDNKKALLDDLLKKQSETDVSANVAEKKATTIRVVERAEMPTGIYAPNISHNIYFSLLMGLIVGVGMAFLLEYLDSSLKNGEDVVRLTQLPFLGIVPTYMIGDDNAKGKDNAKAVVKHEDVNRSPSEATDLLTLYNPNSIASEAFKTVRTSLLLSFPEAPPKTILITSSRPGEGKTFVACNLAISLAQLDKKVILIDADMRNPRIHRVWNMKNEIGLSRFLTSDVKASEVIHPSKSKSVNLITSGIKTPRPAELLASKRLGKLLEELDVEYDHIIIDSPPLIPVADSLILSARVNCVILVIQGGVTPKDVVNMAKQKLAKSEAVMAGVVLNNIDLTDPYYYYRYYTNYGYGYGKEKDPSASPKFLQ